MTLSERGLKTIAVAFLKQWLQDMCPEIDDEQFENMCDLVDIKLAEECKRRRDEWRAAR
jgi:hypothetical protein